MSLKILASYFHSFIDLFFPNLCMACSEALTGNEKVFCTSCLTKLPLTHFWSQKDNPVEQLFWGKVSIENAASFIYFEKESRFQHALHELKYKGKKNVGIQLGKLFGNYLKESSFSAIDVIVPVPLHEKKLKIRGYNQSEMIGNGLAEVMEKPLLSKSVSRVVHTSSQTHKGRYNRWLNVDGIFKCTEPDKLQYKHVLIVDDVVTTGATIESLAAEILKIEGTKVSIATIAVA